MVFTIKGVTMGNTLGYLNGNDFVDVLEFLTFLQEKGIVTFDEKALAEFLRGRYKKLSNVLDEWSDIKN